jgi:hypothetical protein
VALSVCLFVLAFAFVGQPFNQYWGSLYTPLLCLGAARAPAAVKDLWHASGIARDRPGSSANSVYNAE